MPPPSFFGSGLGTNAYNGQYRNMNPFGESFLYNNSPFGNRMAQGGIGQMMMMLFGNQLNPIPQPGTTQSIYDAFWRRSRDIELLQLRNSAVANMQIFQKMGGINQNNQLFQLGASFINSPDGPFARMMSPIIGGNPIQASMGAFANLRGLNMTGFGSTKDITPGQVNQLMERLYNNFYSYKADRKTPEDVMRNREALIDYAKNKGVDWQDAQLNNLFTPGGNLNKGSAEFKDFGNIRKAADALDKIFAKTDVTSDISKAAAKQEAEKVIGKIETSPKGTESVTKGEIEISKEGIKQLQEALDNSFKNEKRTLETFTGTGGIGNVANAVASVGRRLEAHQAYADEVYKPLAENYNVEGGKANIIKFARDSNLPLGDLEKMFSPTGVNRNAVEYKTFETRNQNLGKLGKADLKNDKDVNELRDAVIASFTDPDTKNRIRKALTDAIDSARTGDRSKLTDIVSSVKELDKQVKEHQEAVSKKTETQQATVNAGRNELVKYVTDKSSTASSEILSRMFTKSDSLTKMFTKEGSFNKESSEYKNVQTIIETVGKLNATFTGLDKKPTTIQSVKALTETVEKLNTNLKSTRPREEGKEIVKAIENPEVRASVLNSYILAAESTDKTGVTSQKFKTLVETLNKLSTVADTTENKTKREKLINEVEDSAIKRQLQESTITTSTTAIEARKVAEPIAQGIKDPVLRGQVIDEYVQSAVTGNYDQFRKEARSIGAVGRHMELQEALYKQMKTPEATNNYDLLENRNRIIEHIENKGIAWTNTDMGQMFDKGHIKESSEEYQKLKKLNETINTLRNVKLKTDKTEAEILAKKITDSITNKTEATRRYELITRGIKEENPSLIRGALGDFTEANKLLKVQEQLALSPVTLQPEETFGTRGTALRNRMDVVERAKENNVWTDEQANKIINPQTGRLEVSTPERKAFDELTATYSKLRKLDVAKPEDRKAVEDLTDEIKKVVPNEGTRTNIAKYAKEGNVAAFQQELQPTLDIKDRVVQYQQQLYRATGPKERLRTDPYESTTTKADVLLSRANLLDYTTGKGFFGSEETREGMFHEGGGVNLSSPQAKTILNLQENISKLRDMRQGSTEMQSAGRDFVESILANISDPATKDKMSKALTDAIAKGDYGAVRKATQPIADIAEKVSLHQDIAYSLGKRIPTSIDFTKTWGFNQEDIMSGFYTASANRMINGRKGVLETGEAFFKNAPQAMAAARGLFGNRLTGTELLNAMSDFAGVSDVDLGQKSGIDRMDTLMRNIKAVGRNSNLSTEAMLEIINQGKALASTTPGLKYWGGVEVGEMVVKNSDKVMALAANMSNASLRRMGGTQGLMETMVGGGLEKANTPIARNLGALYMYFKNQPELQQDVLNYAAGKTNYGFTQQGFNEYIASLVEKKGMDPRKRYEMYAYMTNNTYAQAMGLQMAPEIGEVGNKATMEQLRMAAFMNVGGGEQGQAALNEIDAHFQSKSVNYDKYLTYIRENKQNNLETDEQNKKDADKINTELAKKDASPFKSVEDILAATVEQRKTHAPVYEAAVRLTNNLRGQVLQQYDVSGNEIKRPKPSWLENEQLGLITHDYTFSPEQLATSQANTGPVMNRLFMDMLQSGAYMSSPIMAKDEMFKQRAQQSKERRQAEAALGVELDKNMAWLNHPIATSMVNALMSGEVKEEGLMAFLRPLGIGDQTKQVIDKGMKINKLATSVDFEELTENLKGLTGQPEISGKSLTDLKQLSDKYNLNAKQVKELGDVVVEPGKENVAVERAAKIINRNKEQVDQKKDSDKSDISKLLTGARNLQMLDLKDTTDLSVEGIRGAIVGKQIGQWTQEALQPQITKVQTSLYDTVADVAKNVKSDPVAAAAAANLMGAGLADIEHQQGTPVTIETLDKILTTQDKTYLKQESVQKFLKEAGVKDPEADDAQMQLREILHTAGADKKIAQYETLKEKASELGHSATGQLVGIKNILDKLPEQLRAIVEAILQVINAPHS